MYKYHHRLSFSRTGQHCEKCVRLPGCVHGYCESSFECRCEPGWEGMNCDKGKKYFRIKR